MDRERTYRANEAAKLLFISPSHLRTLTREGKVASSHQTPGGQRLYTDADIAAARTIIDGSEKALVDQQLSEGRLALAWSLMGAGTTIAVHSQTLHSSQRLALDLAREMQQAQVHTLGSEERKRVLVVDGTVGHDMLARFAQGRPPDRIFGETTIVDLMNERDAPSSPPRPLTDFVLEGGRMAQGIDLLLGASNSDFAYDMGIEDYTSLLRDCLDHYCCVIIAAPAVDTYSPHGRAWLEASDHVVLVDDYIPAAIANLDVAVRAAAAVTRGAVHACVRRVSDSPLNEAMVGKITVGRRIPLSLIGRMRDQGTDATEAEELQLNELLRRVLTADRPLPAT